MYKVIAILTSVTGIIFTGPFLKKALADTDYPVLAPDIVNLIIDSTATLDRFREGRGVKTVAPYIPKQIFKLARCVAVFPKITKAALIVGARFGDGIASCKNESGQWSRPAFFNLLGGSVGIQAGILDREMVMLFVNENAVNKLKNGVVKEGKDLKIVAAFNSKGEEEDQIGDKDILVYLSDKGMYAGLTLNGRLIIEDRSQNIEYYRENIDVKSILSDFNTSLDGKNVQAFLHLLP